MFGTLSEKFQSLFSGLIGKKKLTEENISDAVRQVRLALLDADVNFGVVSNFIKRVKEKSLGEEVLKSVSPGDQFIKIVHDELVELMGKDEEELIFKRHPAVMMLCGLQGSGKTTSCVKLASYLLKKGMRKKPLIAACDLQRPAAIEQLKRLSSEVGVEVFSIDGEKDPITVAKLALSKAEKEGFDLLILDTAGRLHLDDALMEELATIKHKLEPHEILFVANAATGQDAVKVASEFDARIGITGSILTMLDGSARAGAAISIREVTKKPLKFEGVGEKIADFQLFNPSSMADRILGLGDVINLVRKAEEHIDEETSIALEKKMRKAAFTYNDYLQQMGALKKMGPLKGLMKMLPGVPDLGDLGDPEREFGQMEAMIFSMTPQERDETVEISHNRRLRIAKGSGTTIDDVNRMVKGFKRLKSLCKDMPQMKKQMLKGGMPDFKNFKF